jgi:hypothetical protein
VVRRLHIIKRPSIEDIVAVTLEGVERLNRSTRDLQIVG